MKVEPLPYSAFKRELAQGNIVEVLIEPEYLSGMTKSPPEDSKKQSPEQAGDATNTTPGASETASPISPTQAPSAAKSESAPKSTTAKPTESSKKAKDAKSAPASHPFRTVRVDDPKLIEDLDAADVKYWASKPNHFGQIFWSWIVPIGVMFLLWTLFSRFMGRMAMPGMAFGRSKAKIYPERSTGVTFDDVAGCDEAKSDLEEVVDFLKRPDRYRQLGANIPRGVLLIGPPGTGKTLLARAVAGEAGVTFFSLSGSEFVEMFVGVGAARVRDLFTQAKSAAPCIVFVDELDAIGRQRAVHVMGANDEREQTLNQLLVEMDGFEPNAGVIILAATNRPEVLDRALLRPGRFDRQVLVDSPDIEGREAILQVHARGKPLADGVSLREVAAGTPGFSGADLANALNEAALLAVRRGDPKITQKDIEDAVERVVAGPERRSRRLSEDEKTRVAYHEVGHALVAAFSKYADPVHKITIVPRGRAALGYTMQLPTEEQYLMTEDELDDRIRGMLGGRAAEQVRFGNVSTGAENDLEHATALARQMVTMFGMSEKVGLVHCVRNQNEFLPGMDGGFTRDCSDDTAREIDEEVKRLLASGYKDAIKLLEQHREELDRVAAELLKVETLDRTAFEALLKRPGQEADAISISK